MDKYEVHKTLSGWGVWMNETPNAGQSYKTLKRGCIKTKSEAQIVADKLNNKKLTNKK